MQFYDEAADITPKHVRLVNRLTRQRRASLGWWNWYANRGHFHRETGGAADFRRVSWRRAL